MRRSMVRLKEPGKIQGHAEIPTIRLQTRSIGLSNANAIVLDYHSGVLRVLNAELKGNGTGDVRVTGSVPIQGTGDMNVTANGTLDLGLLQEWTNGGHSSGQVNVELQAKGKKADPMLQGRVRIVNAFYNTDDLPVGIELLNGDITLDGKRLQIREFVGHRGRRNFFGLAAPRSMAQIPALTWGSRLRRCGYAKTATCAPSSTPICH